jgi:hypothetical protein
MGYLVYRGGNTMKFANVLGLRAVERTAAEWGGAKVVEVERRLWRVFDKFGKPIGMINVVGKGWMPPKPTQKVR